MHISRVTKTLVDVEVGRLVIVLFLLKEKSNGNIFTYILKLGDLKVCYLKRILLITEGRLIVQQLIQVVLLLLAVVAINC